MELQIVVDSIIAALLLAILVELFRIERVLGRVTGKVEELQKRKG